MYILDSGCGWIPDAPIKFMYHIINLIKNLTPVILIIMGSLDFGKAVISQKDEEIKRAQAAFIKKLIAGAAVFFVIVFAKWAVKIVNNAGGNTGNAFNCVSLLLNGTYSADNKTYYDGSNITQKPPTTEFDWRTTSDDGTPDQKKCIDACVTGYQNGSYDPKYVDKGIRFDECKKAFDYNTGEYGLACQNLEICAENIPNYNNSTLCEEITSANLNGKCSSEYQNYQTYYDKYGSHYADVPDDACQKYADNYLSNNIEEICANECKN